MAQLSSLALVWGALAPFARPILPLRLDFLLEPVPRVHIPRSSTVDSGCVIEGRRDFGHWGVEAFAGTILVCKFQGALAFCLKATLALCTTVRSSLSHARVLVSAAGYEFPPPYVLVTRLRYSPGGAGSQTALRARKLNHHEGKSSRCQQPNVNFDEPHLHLPFSGCASTSDTSQLLVHRNCSISRNWKQSYKPWTGTRLAQPFPSIARREWRFILNPGHLNPTTAKAVPRPRSSRQSPGQVRFARLHRLLALVPSRPLNRHKGCQQRWSPASFDDTDLSPAEPTFPQGSGKALVPHHPFGHGLGLFWVRLDAENVH